MAERPRELDQRFQMGSQFEAITGSAVALHCCKAHERINRKTENSTPCKIVTPENFSSKFAHVITSGTATTVQNLVKICSLGASPQLGEI